jgi:hypothetical protein
MIVAFELDGQAFTALNGGPMVTFNEAISFQVHGETQAEVDDDWEKLSAGGEATAQQCGWLKDTYGISWQVVPTRLPEMLSDPDAATSGRAMEAMLHMKKIDIEALTRAYEGQSSGYRRSRTGSSLPCASVLRGQEEVNPHMARTSLTLMGMLRTHVRVRSPNGGGNSHVAQTSWEGGVDTCPHTQLLGTKGETLSNGS